MIAYAGMQRLKNGDVCELGLQARPRWPIDQLTSIQK
ncbi:UGMP family protein [Vibrio cholerae]|nr:UGMP family protein [Vibrio cholerae]